MTFKGTVALEYGGIAVCASWGLKGGSPAEGGDITELGLVGDWNPGAVKAFGGEPAVHLSTCSGLTGVTVLMGLLGRWVGLGAVGVCTVGAAGACGGGVADTLGLPPFSPEEWPVPEVVSDAQDWGLLALVEPGDEAVAWFDSEPLSDEPPDPDDAFSALRHLARRFWNHTYDDNTQCKWTVKHWSSAKIVQVQGHMFPRVTCRCCLPRYVHFMCCMAQVCKGHYHFISGHWAGECPSCQQTAHILEAYHNHSF